MFSEKLTREHFKEIIAQDGNDCAECYVTSEPCNVGFGLIERVGRGPAWVKAAVTPTEDGVLLEYCYY